MEEVYHAFKPKKENCYCPSCGKQVTKDHTCRSCGAGMLPRDRWSMKKIHALMIILSVLGGGLMWYGYYEATKITPIADINASMEGLTVRIAGTVVDIDYDSRYEKTTITVNDSTGEIDCFGWSEFTSSMLKAEALPSIGDGIIIEGKVDVYNSTYSGLIVQIEIENAQAYVINWNHAKKKDINDILLNDLHKKVQIKGNITDKYEDSDGSTINYMFIDISDETGDITVFISGDLFAIAGDRAVIPQENQTVAIIGWVDKYNNQLEIIPSNTTKGAIKIEDD